MTPFMSSMLLVCFLFLFCFGLSPRTYIPNPQILRSASLLFPHVYLVHSFLSDLLALPLLYLLTYGLSLSCTQPSDGAYNEYIS